MGDGAGGLSAHFPAVSREAWVERFARGRVLGDDGQALDPGAPYRVGLEVHYYREVVDEPVIPLEERVLHLDEHLLVVDKPHFLPVSPSGAHVHETLLARLIRRTGNPDLVPLHRLDRETAGVVLFSVDPMTRAAYQALFRERRIEKHYEAIAPALRGSTSRSCVEADWRPASPSSACVKSTASRTARRAST